jgi:ABC-type glycerol-3-phosphate transport system substrate-binding protein
MNRWIASSFVALVTISSGSASELPKATQKAITDLHLNSSMLNGLEDELKVPKAWLDAAAKEEEVSILGTWHDRQFRKMTVAFTERYPHVKLNYSRASNSGRIMKVIIALREGRVLADVIIDTSTGGALFKKAKALADLRDLPGFRNVLSHSAAPDGTYIGYKIVYPN